MCWERLPENGGVVMVTFVTSFVNDDPDAASLADVADHIEHVRDVAGIAHVGIGSDYDGIPTTPAGLEDVSTFPDLFAELSRRGWSEADLAALAGDNVLRAMRGPRQPRLGSAARAGPRPTQSDSLTARCEWLSRRVGIAQPQGG